MKKLMIKKLIKKVDDEKVDDEDCTWTDVVCIGLILRSAVSHCSSPSSSITFILWKRWWLCSAGVESPLTITLITTSDFLQMTSPIMKTEKTKPVSVLLPLCWWLALQEQRQTLLSTLAQSKHAHPEILYFLLDKDGLVLYGWSNRREALSEN